MWCEYTCMVVVFGIFEFLAVIFLYAAAFLGLAAGYYVNNTKSNIGSGAIACNSTYSNVLQGIQVIDAYVQNVDQGLCSSACQCQINLANQAQFAFNDPTNYLTWNVSTASGASNFSMCPGAVQLQAYNATGSTNQFFAFNDTLFATKWSSIEKDNNCTGFCSTSYPKNFTVLNALNVSITQTRVVKQMKYLFSDINRGIPTQPCFIPIMTFMANFFINFGAMSLIIAMTLSVVFLLICSWCCCPAADEYPSHPPNVELGQK